MPPRCRYDTQVVDRRTASVSTARAGHEMHYETRLDLVHPDDRPMLERHVEPCWVVRASARRSTGLRHADGSGGPEPQVPRMSDRRDITKPPAGYAPGVDHGGTNA